MSEIFDKSIRNGSYISLVTFLISFFYGVIWLGFIQGRDDFSIINLIIGFVASLFVGIMPFIPIFILSLIIYYFIEKIREDREK